MPPAAVEKMEIDAPVKTEVKEEVKDVKVITVESLKGHCSLLDRGEAHFVGRILQVLHKTRKQLTNEVLHNLINSQPFQSSLIKDSLLRFIPAPPRGKEQSLSTPMEVDSKASVKSPRPVKKAGVSAETELYLHLLVVVYLVDQNSLDNAKTAADTLITRADVHDSRLADGILAKGFYYLALIHEKQSKLHEISSFLNSRLRTATLRHLRESQATLIFTLLRCYLINRQYQAASKLVSKAAFPEGANNNDLARYLYYQGRIKALQLEYVAAAGYFLQAMRKAPQEAAIGFKQNAQKWVIVISLLQGEIPERSIFRQPIYRKCLVPYLELTQAVRLGDLAEFNKLIETHGPTFQADETLTLIVRLRQNVIKTAVKQISCAYSRIPIKDIAAKLQISSQVDTEYMVAKAIADGAIDAIIVADSSEGERYMKSSETADIYRTTEPQKHFDSRIKYCLELHNQAVKSLRFPPKNKIEVETIEAQREREQQELEFAKEMAEEDDDDF